MSSVCGLVVVSEVFWGHKQNFVQGHQNPRAGPGYEKISTQTKLANQLITRENIQHLIRSQNKTAQNLNNLRLIHQIQFFLTHFHCNYCILSTQVFWSNPDFHSLPNLQSFNTGDTD